MRFYIPIFQTEIIRRCDQNVNLYLTVTYIAEIVEGY